MKTPLPLIAASAEMINCALKPGPQWPRQSPALGQKYEKHTAAPAVAVHVVARTVILLPSDRQNRQTESSKSTITVCSFSFVTFQKIKLISLGL